MELDQPDFEIYYPQQANLKRSQHYDRFIPNRSIKVQHVDHHPWADHAETNYNRMIAKSLVQDVQQDRLLSFREDSVSTLSTDQCIYDMISRRAQLQADVQRSNINMVPEKILDAPELRDDYYLNLLDWSPCGPLAIGLNQKVYSYTPQHISQICSLDEGYVCSVAFQAHHPLLAVGTSTGRIHLYDIQRQCLLRVMRGHFNRVSSLAFDSLLYSGSKDTTVMCHDIKSPNNVSMRFDGHRGQVCGLKYDPCGLVSGSNDNNAIVWDVNAGRQRHLLSGHKAAVKALAWCPWQRGLLATGGGAADKTMKFWNTENGQLLNSVNTDSQVSSLVWNRTDREIVSSHGYSDNQITVWKVSNQATHYPQVSKTIELRGHTQRVLYLALSPDGQTICSASADETLRFWRVFGGNSIAHPIHNQWSNSSLDNCFLR